MAQALHAAIPQSTLKIIPGGRHLTPIQCPDEIAAEIAGLLERG
jgi:3-oxoadipate enol-lactonase